MFDISGTNIVLQQSPSEWTTSIKSMAHEPACFAMQGFPKCSLLLGHLFIMILRNGKVQNRKELSSFFFFSPSYILFRLRVLSYSFFPFLEWQSLDFEVILSLSIRAKPNLLVHAGCCRRPWLTANSITFCLRDGSNVMEIPLQSPARG